MDRFLQPPLPSSDDVDSPLPPPSPLATMQMSNAYYNELDFDHGDGGPRSRYEMLLSEDDDEDEYQPTFKKQRTEPRLSKKKKKKPHVHETFSNQLVAKVGRYDSPEEGEISDDPDVNTLCKQSSSQIVENRGRPDEIFLETFRASEVLDKVECYPLSDGSLLNSSYMGNDFEDDEDDGQSDQLANCGTVDGEDVDAANQGDDEGLKAETATYEALRSEFEIIDDLSSDNGDETNVGNSGLYSDESEAEVEVDEDEIEAMLEEGLPNTSEGGKEKGAGKGRSSTAGPVDFQAPTMQDKVILLEKGQDPFDILPEGWLVVTHQSGMPIYLHKSTRVCTVSRPYFLGPGSARKHEIPVSAVPCLQYRRAMTKDSAVGGRPPTVGGTHDAPTTSDGDAILSSDVVSDRAKSDAPVVDQDVATGDASSNPDVRSLTVPTKVQSAEDHKKSNSLSPLEFRAYCQNLFEFKTITVRRFRRWKDRRKHNSLLKKASRPTLPPSTNLITCAIPADKESHLSFRRKAFVLNPAGKSAVCILHEYAQHTMRIQPRYIFRELENSQMPYSATVVINEVQYGTGYATSKKMAKLEAARITLKILIPEIGKVKTDEQTEDLSYFDEIKIEDPRVVDLCNKAGHPTPYQILGECLKRNYGMGDTQVQMEVNTVKHQKSEFIMRVGRHEAKVICKNKREGKQQAAQAILQLMHPYIHTWGSLLRLYAKASEIKDKREEEYSVTKLQTTAHPNKAILEKLRQEMTKLYHKHDSFQSNIKGKLKLTAPELVSSELRAVDL